MQNCLLYISLFILCQYLSYFDIYAILNFFVLHFLHKNTINVTHRCNEDIVDVDARKFSVFSEIKNVITF